MRNRVEVRGHTIEGTEARMIANGSDASVLRGDDSSPAGPKGTMPVGPCVAVARAGCPRKLR